MMKREHLLPTQTTSNSRCHIFLFFFATKTCSTFTGTAFSYFIPAPHCRHFNLRPFLSWGSEEGRLLQNLCTEVTAIKHAQFASLETTSANKKSKFFFCSLPAAVFFRPNVLLLHRDCEASRCEPLCLEKAMSTRHDLQLDTDIHRWIHGLWDHCLACLYPRPFTYFPLK